LGIEEEKMKEVVKANNKINETKWANTEGKLEDLNSEKKKVSENLR
jgi:hypothetical protein